MSDFGSNLDLVPVVLKVKTFKELTIIARKNNIINHQKYNYALPVPFVKGFYELQFYADVTKWKNPNVAKPKETGEVVK